jgi:hypothetical protein
VVADHTLAAMRAVKKKKKAKVREGVDVNVLCAWCRWWWLVVLLLVRLERLGRALSTAQATL